MNSSTDNSKKEYTTPKFERYGDVRDLTQTATPTNGHFDGNIAKGAPWTH